MDNCFDRVTGQQIIHREAGISQTQSAGGMRPIMQAAEIYK